MFDNKTFSERLALRITELDKKIEDEKAKRRGLTRELMALMNQKDNLMEHVNGK